MTLEGAPPERAPRVPAARDRLMRAASVLSSTAARASPLRVRGGITRGRARRPAVALSWCGVLLVVVVVAGKGPRACPCARYPPSPRGSSWGGGVGMAAVGSRSHPPPLPPVPSAVCVPLARARSRLVPLPRPGVHRACGACRVCSRAVRWSPRFPFRGSVPTTGGNRGISFPSSVSGRARVLRDLIAPLGADVFGGTVVGRVRRVVGRRDPLPLEGLWRSASSVSVSVSLVLVSPGAPGGPSVLGRLGAVGVVAGLLGECAV